MSKGTTYYSVVEIKGNNVIVTGDTHAALVQEPKFLNWAKKINPMYVVEEIFVASSVRAPNGKFLFAFLQCKVVDPENPEGPRVYYTVFLRGDSVAILVVLRAKETQQLFTLLVKQLRFPMGDQLVEVPAGMLDDDLNFKGKAADEIREETGLVLTNLTVLGSFWTSPGANDEKIHGYLATIELPLQEILALQGQLTGLAEEHEHITLVVVELFKLSAMAGEDGKAVSLFLKYLEHNPDVMIAYGQHIKSQPAL